MLRLDTLPAATAQVFAHLYAEPLLSGFMLIGGTALSLQIGHRQSADLDFYSAAAQLPSRTLNAVLANARRAGFAVQDMLSPSRMSRARINYAVDLHDWVQDWAVGGVKVSFSVFEGFRSQMRAITAYPPVTEADHHRDVMRGLIALDTTDEGFAGIGATITLDALYAFFEARISDYEREEARRIVAQVRGEL